MGFKGSGIYTLDDLMSRCVVHTDTKCWDWGMAYIDQPTGHPAPVCYLPPGVAGTRPGNRTNMPARKASWLLSGRSLKEKFVVWVACGNPKCVAPHHLKAGTRADLGAWLSATGRNKGNPLRKAINAKNYRSQLTPVETVRKAEKMLEDGCLRDEIVKAVGVCRDTVHRIALGRHPHSSNFAGAVQAASVFTWRP